MTLNFQPIWVFKYNSEKLTKKKIKAEKIFPNLMLKKNLIMIWISYMTEHKQRKLKLK